jgi:hypothetical protein
MYFKGLIMNISPGEASCPLSVDMLIFDIWHLPFPTVYDMSNLLAIWQDLCGLFYKFRTKIVGVLDIYSECLIMKIRPGEDFGLSSVELAPFY